MRTTKLAAAMNDPSQEQSEFDEFAEDYDQALNRGLVLSGENKEYFAASRLNWLKRLVIQRSEIPIETVVDFGCGTGTATPFILESFGPTQLVGIDPSKRSVEEARGQWADFSSASFQRNGAGLEEAADLVYCNGVFHHIPPADRPEAIEQVARSLKPGGLFALWENNPWNPVTRHAMSRVPFDRDAVLVWPSQARRLMREGGFEILRTDFIFFFPRSLRGLRFLEPSLCKVPLGGQYLVLGRKLT